MNLRDLRKIKGYTVKYVADQLGIKPRTLNKKERDNSFTVLQMEKLCELYNVRINEINT